MATVSGLEMASLVNGNRVHRRVYTDPVLFQEEQQRLFGRTWLFIGHESEVPAPGDYKTDTVAGYPIVMSRAEDGQVHVLVNRCRHRGAKVCNLPYGNSSMFSCLYHGWTYSNDGRLVAVPHRELCGAGFDPADFGLFRVPRVASYRGFVFGSLSPEGPTLEEHLGRAAAYIDLLVQRAPDEEIQVVKPVTYAYPGNWKFQVENYVDNIHARFTHISASDGRRRIGPDLGHRFTDASDVADRETPAPHIHLIPNGHLVLEYGIGRAQMPFGGYGYSARNQEYLQRMIEKHGPEEGRTLAEMDTHIVIYPNLLLHTQYAHYRVIKPRSVSETHIYGYPYRLKGAPEQMNDDLVTFASEHISAAGAVQVDDMEAFTRVQEGLQGMDDGYLVFPYGTSEIALRDEDGDVVVPSMTEHAQLHVLRQWATWMSTD